MLRPRLKYISSIFALVTLVTCQVTQEQVNNTHKHLSPKFIEGYISATDTDAANAMHGFHSYKDPFFQKNYTPILFLEQDTSDHEVGYFCGHLNAYITHNVDHWAEPFRDSVSHGSIEDAHPAVTAACGLALCSLLIDITISDAIEELGIEQPEKYGVFAENYRLDLGHGLWLLIKVDLSNSKRLEDGRLQTPPIQQLRIHQAYLYRNKESITSMLDWARQYYKRP